MLIELLWVITCILYKCWVLFVIQSIWCVTLYLPLLAYGLVMSIVQSFRSTYRSRSCFELLLFWNWISLFYTFLIFSLILWHDISLYLVFCISLCVVVYSKKSLQATRWLWYAWENSLQIIIILFWFFYDNCNEHVLFVYLFIIIIFMTTKKEKKNNFHDAFNIRME